MFGDSWMAFITLKTLSGFIYGARYTKWAK